MWQLNYSDGKFSEAGNYYLRLKNNQSEAGGNDFGIDSIYFGLESEAVSHPDNPADPNSVTNFDTSSLNVIPNINLSKSFYTVTELHNNLVGRVFEGGSLQVDASQAGVTLFDNFTIQGAGGTIDTNGNNLTIQGNMYQGTQGEVGSLTKTGNGTLTLSGTNTYEGGTTVSGGILAGTVSSLQGNITNNATVVFDQASEGAYSGVMDGNGILVKSNAGVLSFSGNHNHGFSGLVDVQGGKFVLNGSIVAGNVAVRANTTLGGNATIASLNNSGTVAPGNSIGTINVVGNFVANSGATTEIEINNAGQCDLINVGGSATINSDAVLKVVPLDTITLSHRYKFMMTADGISGEFDVLDTSLIDFTADIRGNDYYIVVARTPFSRVARTQNQHQIAAYLERTYSSATGDYRTVMNDLMFLPTDDEVRHAMDQMDGELFPTLSIVNLQAVSNLNRMVADQLRPGAALVSDGFADSQIALGDMVVRGQNGRCCDWWTGWTAGYGLGGRGYGDGNAHGYNFGTGGMVVGIDRRLDRQTRFGLLYGNGFASTRLEGLSDSSSIDSHVFGLYLKRRNACWYSTTIADMGFDKYKSRRRIAIGAIDRSAESEHDGWQSTVYQEIGRTMGFGRGLYLQPYGALQYIHIRQEGFDETGADSLDLHVAGEDLNSIRTLLGGRLIANRLLPWLGRGELAFRTHWAHELLDQTTGIVSTSLSGGGTPGFEVRGVDLGRDWVILGPDVMWQYKSHIQLRAAYDLTFNANQAYHTGGGSVTFTW
ncbi:MAG: autotransporter domain-containing protein [Planctomycetota bacterium]|nr:autotransporter domain-containing protein [Planctomycetota bacterium]